MMTWLVNKALVRPNGASLVIFAGYRWQQEFQNRSVEQLLKTLEENCYAPHTLQARVWGWVGNTFQIVAYYE